MLTIIPKIAIKIIYSIVEKSENPIESTVSKWSIIFISMWWMGLMHCLLGKYILLQNIHYVDLWRCHHHLMWPTPFRLYNSWQPSVWFPDEFVSDAVIQLCKFCCNWDYCPILFCMSVINSKITNLILYSMEERGIKGLVLMFFLSSFT